MGGWVGGRAGCVETESAHCEKFRTLISNSWPILQTSVTFPAHASIGMYGIKLIFECHISEKAGSISLQDSNDG